VDVEAGILPLAPQLHDFSSHDCTNVTDALLPHLHLFVELRALSLEFEGPLDGISLLPLHRLQYLMVQSHNLLDRSVWLAVRRLSVQQRLRHVVLWSHHQTPWDANFVGSELSAPDAGLAPVELTTLVLIACLKTASIPMLMSLPHLTHLSLSCDLSTNLHGNPFNDPLPPLPPSLPVSPLQILRVYMGCRRANGLLVQAAARAPQLRSLNLHRLHERTVPLLLHMQQLRDLRLEGVSLTEEQLPLVRSLASLPLFTRLTLQPAPYGLLSQHHRLTVGMRRAIGESHSWREQLPRCSQLAQLQRFGSIRPARLQSGGRGPGPAPGRLPSAYHMSGTAEPSHPQTGARRRRQVGVEAGGGRTLTMER
jgi:hypothetical protein